MTWKTIPGYPGYSANTDGHIRNEKTGHVSKGGDAGEYLKVSVYAKAAKKPSLCYVHDLICRAFHGLPTKGQVVLHKDDNKKNCKPSNLKWGSQSENIQSAYDNGLISKESSIVPRDIVVSVVIGSSDPSVVNRYIDVLAHLKELNITPTQVVMSEKGSVSGSDLYLTHHSQALRCQGGSVIDLGHTDVKGYTEGDRRRVEKAIDDTRLEVNGFQPNPESVTTGVLMGW